MTSISGPAPRRTLPLPAYRGLYPLTPIDALFTAVPEQADGRRAQARADRGTGALAVLLIVVIATVATLVTLLAAVQLVHLVVAG